ncbi:aldehyde dehydrogenase family protein [Rhodococcus sp. OK302]|uniref:aldehyde dehydrogenase family protein n=1 Tax=Rhodococcus sp. OK302 TaxID=1882769 RepID=UPI000B93ABDC|nr:aldehyde dehydrogenase family protein [Rhodococcus sp. OK302]OYD67155.1 acyl-CoA reductase-like NAD-dependent aldehyde dehydrogenase [Rhodococcus sp. OK302]
MTEQLGSQSTSIDPHADDNTFASFDPRDNTVIARYPVADRTAVDNAVGTARTAARWWDQLGFSGRQKVLRDFRSAIANNAEAMAAIISAETGKPADDAVLEVMLALEHLDWAARNAQKVLRRRRVGAGLISANQSASVGYRPMGVVGVIGPWNYPLYTPMGSIGYALAAGNAVIFKPSELSPGVGIELARLWNIAAPGHPVLQTITGDGQTGALLCSSGVDKIAFTGSTATAKRVMATCAETLTPLVAECGGKDAMLVNSDANLDAAVSFAAFGAVGNGGQTCAGVERIYVAAPVYDAFLSKLTTALTDAHAGDSDSATYGPMTLGKQTAIVRGHVEDALNRGAKAVLGGLDSFRGPFIDPIILTEVPENSTAITEETFGPSVVVNKVEDMDEAIERANASKYGLGASVFTKSSAQGRAIAERLECVVVTVNSVLGFASIAALPFGGVGDSGFGRIHGADGLREFSSVKSVAVQRFNAPLDLLTIERKARAMKISRWMLAKRHG